MREKTKRIVWPVLGLHAASAVEEQPKGTAYDLRNVRAFDPRSGRLRGGQRAGLSKYLNAQLSGSNRIQDIAQVTQRAGTPSATQMNVRTIQGVAVSQGTVAKFTTSAFTTATSGTSALSSTAPVIFSTEHLQVLYFADGANAKKYDPSTNTVSAWAAAAGTLPSDSGNLPRLIEVWRGRIVLAGIKSDPQNWFMGAVGEWDDWDYNPTPTCNIQAVAGSTAQAGKCPDIVNTFIPFSDDLAIFGGDHSIWQLTGDPMEGGRFDCISSTIGMAWGRPWCLDPVKIMYFFGSRGGVYKMAPKSLPERISGPIDELLSTVNLNTSIVRLAWNDREQGVHVFISPLTTGSTVHYFYDVRNQAWWADSFSNTNHNPVAVHVFDGDDPADRAVLLGGQDGRIYKWDIAAANDDSTNISSYVWLGPIGLEGAMRKGQLKEMQATIPAGSGNVTYGVYSGRSGEAAVASTAMMTGTWTTGVNPCEHRRAVGDLLYVKLSSNAATAWALESLECVIGDTGRSFQRRGW